MVTCRKCRLLFWASTTITWLYILSRVGSNKDDNYIKFYNHYDNSVDDRCRKRSKPKGKCVYLGIKHKIHISNCHATYVIMEFESEEATKQAKNVTQGQISIINQRVYQQEQEQERNQYNHLNIIMIHDSL